MDLSAVAVELYQLPPSAFTAARGDKAKEAKSGGEAELARRIARFPKPTAAAWAINALARRGAEKIDAVLQLGSELRRAQEQHDSAGLRDLGQQRSRVLTAAANEARSLAEELGVKVSDAAADEIQETLRAAMADPAAALAIRSGQLVKTLSTNGLDPVDLSQAVAVPEALPEVFPEGSPAGAAEPAADVGLHPGPGSPPAKPKVAKAEARQSAADRKRAEAEVRQQRELEEAQAALQEAQSNAEEAEADLAEAESQAAESSELRESLAAKIAELKEQLADLQQDLEAAERASKFAERSRTLAGRLAAQERQNLERAKERLANLRP
jgi:hypothetical protein